MEITAVKEYNSYDFNMVPSLSNFNECEMHQGNEEECMTDSC